MERFENKHIGQNIQAIRKLRGMKQSDFAKAMGVNQQNISRMENKNNISDEKLEQASKILEASTKQITNFDRGVIVYNNVFSNDQINYPIKEVLQHFKEALDIKDQEIDRLKAELSKKDLKGSKSKNENRESPILKKA